MQTLPPPLPSRTLATPQYYSSLYSTKSSPAALIGTGQVSAGKSDAVGDDVKESMDFIARYCRGENVRPSAALAATTASSYQPSGGLPGTAYATTPSHTTGSTHSQGPSWLTPNQGQAQLTPSTTYPAATNSSGIDSNAYRTGPSWAQQPQSSLDYSSSAIVGGPGGRQRAMVSDGRYTPYSHHSPIRPNTTTATPSAGAAAPPLVNFETTIVASPLSEPGKANTDLTSRNTPNLRGPAAGQTSAPAYRPATTVQPAPATHNSYPSAAHNDSTFTYAAATRSNLQPSQQSHQQQPAQNGGSGGVAQKGKVWSPNSGHPPPGSEITVTSRYESFNDTDRTLLYIAMWLKSYFSDNPQAEGAIGVETLTDEDTTEILRCYKDELTELIRELKRGGGGGHSHSAATDRHSLYPLGTTTIDQQQSQPVGVGRRNPGPSGTGGTGNPPHQAQAAPPPAQQQPPAHASQPEPNPSVHPAAVGVEGSLQYEQRGPPPQVRPRPALPPPSQSDGSVQQSATPAPQQNYQQQHQQQQQPSAPTVAPTTYSNFTTAPPSQQARTQSASGSRNASPDRRDRPKQPLGKLFRQMRKGSYLVKYGRNGEALLRYFLVTDEKLKIEGDVIDCPHLSWTTDVGGKPSGSLPLLYLQDVIRGTGDDREKIFKKDKSGSVVGIRNQLIRPSMCFILIFPKRTMGLYANSLEDYDLWVDGLEGVVAANRANGAVPPQSE
jgi:hypothetical protein